VLSGPPNVAGQRLPLRSGQSCTPRSMPIAGLEVTRHHQGFTRVHPSGLPLRLWAPDGTGPLGLDHL